MPRTSKKTQLLDAAAAIVNEYGSEYLTLDAVAKRAGVSKGGLLYHFKSKTALIEQGKWLRAFVEATREHRSENAAITSSMLAAEGNNRHLLSPLQETYKIWQSYIENDGLDKIDATIMRLAVDGLWLSEIFGLDALDESMREAVLERLTNYSKSTTNRTFEQ